MQLKNKIVLITGAGRGIGRACATRFASEGAMLILLDVCSDIEGVPYSLASRSQLDHTERLCREFGASTLTVQADVRSGAAIERAVLSALDRFGRIDILINNAGVVCPSGKSVHELTEAEWQIMIDIDLSGAWRMLRAVAPGMLEQRSGSIINVASTAGMVGYRHFAGYVAAKHGIVGLTRAAALDFAPNKVRVNALCPGSVRDASHVEGRMLSEIARCLSVPLSEHEETFIQAQPMNALIEPEDISSAAVWLASDQSRQVTGAVIAIDGGFSAR